MCGRYALTQPPEAVRAAFRFVEQPNFPPRYNIAPTQPAPIVRAARHADGETRRHFALARWGFLPAFVKDPQEFPLIFNARSETLAEKASFRNALRRRRCLFPADAFYEWRREPRTRGRPARTPFLFRRRDGATMGLAGLYETWMGPNGEEVETPCPIFSSNCFPKKSRPHAAAGGGGSEALVTDALVERGLVYEGAKWRLRHAAAAGAASWRACRSASPTARREEGPARRRAGGRGRRAF
jgi:hypothetical protein